jgi:hypothetical protein
MISRAGSDIDTALRAPLIVPVAVADGACTPFMTSFVSLSSSAWTGHGHPLHLKHPPYVKRQHPAPETSVPRTCPHSSACPARPHGKRRIYNSGVSCAADSCAGDPAPAWVTIPVGDASQCPSSSSRYPYPSLAPGTGRPVPQRVFIHHNASRSFVESPLSAYSHRP